MTPNYEVLVYLFGSYPRGSVLPEYVVRQAGPVAELVARGAVRETLAPVNVDLVPPEPFKSAAVDAHADLFAELNTLRAESAAAQESAAAWQGRCEAAELARADLTREIARYVEENNHLRRAVTELEGRVQLLIAERDQLAAEKVELARELDAATAPSGA